MKQHIFGKVLNPYVEVFEIILKGYTHQNHANKLI